MAQIIDGKSIAEQTKVLIAAEVDLFHRQTGIRPGLATLLVGENPASQVYIKNKIKSTEACGMVSFHQTLSAATTEADLLKRIELLNQDSRVHGILVQLPLPKHINADKVIEAIAPHKDVDGFHPQNMGNLLIGKPALQPCTPYGVMQLLTHSRIELSGKDAIIVGRSNIVGKPMAMMLLQANATVTIAHSRTKDLNEKISKADLVVAAVGIPQFVKGEWIKEGAVVIDVGINKLASGKLCGDVDYESAAKRAGWITPVPGGVGPMTIAMLLHNTLTAAKLLT